VVDLRTYVLVHELVTCNLYIQNRVLSFEFHVAQIVVVWVVTPYILVDTVLPLLEFTMT
jgi:hypothetical protein